LPYALLERRPVRGQRNIEHMALALEILRELSAQCDKQRYVILLDPI